MRRHFPEAAGFVWTAIIAGMCLFTPNASAQTISRDLLNGNIPDYKKECDIAYYVIEDSIEQIANTGKIDASGSPQRLGLTFTEKKINDLSGFGTALQGEIGLYSFSFFKGVRARQRADVQNDDFAFSITLSGYYPQNTFGCPNRSQIVDRLSKIGIKEKYRADESLGFFKRYESSDGKLEAQLFITHDDKLRSFYIGRPLPGFVL